MGLVLHATRSIRNIDERGVDASIPEKEGTER
jgi:hypothetical protein